MKKVISLFQRNYDGDRLVRDEIVPGAEWVVAGEGVATRKFDGTCCLVEGGKLYKRYDHKPDNWKAIQRALKQGRDVPEPIFSSPPDDFRPAQDPDPITLHWPGWLPVGDGPEDKWHRQVNVAIVIPDRLDKMIDYVPDGTYELCGPAIGGNTEGFEVHTLVRHGVEQLVGVPVDFDGLKEYLREANIEGIVWHHPDGRMVKIKRKDFFKAGEA